MRQLKAAHPLASDFIRSKRCTVTDSSQTGLKCIHCMNKPDPCFKTAVGRSFPSAPDNMSSTLNSSMLQHLQKCPYVPEDVKRALTRLKAIHSAQCSSLRFGSQRRFFNLVFERLKDAQNNETDILAQEDADLTSQGQRTIPKPTNEAYDMVLAQCGFIETSDDCFECQFCRMVPLSLRSRDSIAIGLPQVEFFRGHKKICEKDQCNFSNAAEALKIATEEYPSLADGAILSFPKFVAVLNAALGDKLVEAIVEGLKEAMAFGRNSELKCKSRGLWNMFPTSVDGVKVAIAFKEFADTVPDLKSDLLNELQFLRFLQIISPSLVIAVDVTAANEAEE
jgi:hypothetical protein